MRRRSGWVLAVASIASLMVALDALVVTTALPTIRVHLGASIEQLEWTVNAYTLSFAVLLMTGAALGERFGRRRMFAVGLGLFSGASAACALAPNVGLLIAARAVQGVGAALVMPLGLTLLSAAYPPERRARALGIFSGITGLAVLGGPVIGGAITQGIAWQWIFWINVPIGLLTIPVVFRRVDESYGPRTAPDVGGLALITGAAVGIVWALVRGNSAGWGSVEVLTSLVVGASLAVAFVLWEWRTAEPMLPMGLFASRPFASGNAAIFFLCTSLYGAVFFMAQFLQTAQHQGPLDAGLRLLPWTGTLFIVAPLTGARISRIGERPFAVAGLLLQAAGMGWIALIAGPEVAYWRLVAPLAIAGCGVSMAMPAIQNAVMSSVAPASIGKASGTFNMLRQLGGVFGIATLVAVFSGAGSYGSAQLFSDGFTAALGVSAALSVVGALVSAGLPARAQVATVSAPNCSEIATSIE
ncbi:MAG TPA: DHA2 family efflux MFS transporter permease subunit [Solirubrobacteraceae bacterium]|nr:DHA2 family efflux MFS transporter permease subunit [Solirubrobacteraceae bacterium]